MAEDTATRRAPLSATVSHGYAGTVKCAIATIEQTAASSGDTIKFDIKVPSNARPLGASTLYYDDLATSGSPTLDLGLFAVDSNITDDSDALTDGIAVSGTGASAKVVKDAANYGKRFWEYVNGQTTDPGGLLEIKGTFRDAATTATGTVTLEVLYIVD